jgi:hypothetical protein
MAVNSPSESPRAENWDQTSAAQQLVGLKQDSSASTISRQQQRRQHSSQSQSPPHRQQHQQHRKHQPICEALDLEDLQNFVSWDIHGIIDISDTVSASNHDDEAKMSSWGSMV